MKRWVIVSLCVLLCIFSVCGLRSALGQSGDYLLEPIGFPKGTGVMKMEITIEVNGVKTTKTVTIPKGAIVATTGIARNPGESNKDYAQRMMDNRAEYSYQKALVIANAINTTFQAEFAALGKQATVGFAPVSNKTPGNPIYQEDLLYQGPEVFQSYGSVQIPNVSKDKNMPSIKFTENKVLGEGGNGGRFLPPPPPQSSFGTKVGMTWATPDVQQVALGSDPNGNPSEVEFGIDGQYVATVYPTLGMSDVTVMQLLAAQLDLNGVPATYDSLLHELSLDAPLPDGQALVWGNTDSELEFTTTFQGLSEPVPEPSTLALLMLGTVGLLAMRKGFR